MYALLAYERTLNVPGQGAQKQLAFEVRNFGCFNGFNTERAFHFGTDGMALDLIVNVQQDGSYAGQQAWSQVLDHRLTPANLGCTSGLTWRCLGIGYLNSRTPANPPSWDHAKQQARGLGANSFIGNALSREGFQDMYYDCYEGTCNGRTIRELTPNERLLSNFGRGFAAERAGLPQEVINSRVAVGFVCNRSAMNSLIQFVGSERSSGQAISYLQTWRNVAEQQGCGWAGQPEKKDFLHSVLNTRIHSQASVIAFLSYFVNGGSDSDNITYAGNKYIDYCSRAGFWNTAGVYRNTNSMMQEGRYNKGGQSDELNHNTNRLISGRGNRQWSSGDELTNIKNALAQMLNIRSEVSFRSLTSGRRMRERVINALTQSVDRILNNNPLALTTAYFNRCASLPDLAAPPPPTVPETRHDGASLTFRQWVTQTSESLTQA